MKWSVIVTCNQTKMAWIQHLRCRCSILMTHIAILLIRIRNQREWWTPKWCYFHHHSVFCLNLFLFKANMTLWTTSSKAWQKVSEPTWNQYQAMWEYKNIFGVQFWAHHWLPSKYMWGIDHNHADLHINNNTAFYSMRWV